MKIKNHLIWFVMFIIGSVAIFYTVFQGGKNFATAAAIFAIGVLVAIVIAMVRNLAPWQKQTTSAGQCNNTADEPGLSVEEKEKLDEARAKDARLKVNWQKLEATRESAIASRGKMICISERITSERLVLNEFWLLAIFDTIDSADDLVRKVDRIIIPGNDRYLAGICARAQLLSARAYAIEAQLPPVDEKNRHAMCQ